MTNFVQSPVSVQRLVSRPGLPKRCDQPLKASPFESVRDPVTGRWVTYFPNAVEEANSVEKANEIEKANAIEEAIVKPALPSIPLAKPRSVIVPVPRCLLETLESFHQWGKSVAFALRIYSQVHNIRKIFTEFWIVAR